MSIHLSTHAHTLVYTHVYAHVYTHVHSQTIDVPHQLPWRRTAPGVSLPLPGTCRQLQLMEVPEFAQLTYTQWYEAIAQLAYVGSGTRP